MQGTALKDLEIDVGAIQEELRQLGQVDDSDCDMKSDVIMVAIMLIC